MTFYRDATQTVSYAHTYDMTYARLLRRVDRDDEAASSDIWEDFFQEPKLSSRRRTENLGYRSDLLPGLMETASSPGAHLLFVFNKEYDLEEAVGAAPGAQGAAGYAIYDYVRSAAGGRLEQVTRTYSGAATIAGPDTRYTYYAGGRLETVTDVNGVQTITYNDAGQIERVAIGTEGDYVFEYDAVGRNTRLVYPDGHVRVQRYDTRGRMWQRCYEYANPAQTRCYQAAYDDVGNPIELKDPEGDDVVEVDVLDRLKSVERGGVVDTFDYNALGALKVNANAVLDDQRPRTKGPGEADTAVPSPQGRRVTIDDVGSIQNLFGTEVRYNGRGQVIVVGTGAVKELYGYDAFGRRISRTNPADPSKAERYVYDGDNLTGVLNSTGGVTDKYLYDGVDHPLRLKRGPSIVYYELDLAGNVRRLRGPGGTDLGGYGYTAFGKTVADTATVNQPVRWKGRWYVDAAGGLYDMRGRWWSPELGVFLSVDEFAYHDARSTLWGWPGQNPLRYSDPSGHYARVCRSGNQVEIILPMVFFERGRADDEARIAMWIKDVQDRWSGTFGDLKVTTRVERLSPGSNLPHQRNDVSIVETIDPKLGARAYVNGGWRDPRKSRTGLDEIGTMTIEELAGGATFSHEVGHLLGLPDLRGPRSNIMYYHEKAGGATNSIAREQIGEILANRMNSFYPCGCR